MSDIYEPRLYVEPGRLEGIDVDRLVGDLSGQLWDLQVPPGLAESTKVTGTCVSCTTRCTGTCPCMEDFGSLGQW